MNPKQLFSQFDRVCEAPYAISHLRHFDQPGLAFRGKLLPQREEDGSAESLLKSILSAHPRDRKFGGRIKRGNLQLDPFSCQGVSEIPATWRWTYLDFVCEEISDVDHKMPKAVAEGVPFVSARDLKDDGSIDFDNAKRISKEDYERLSRKVQIRRGDIIYSRIGTIGKARLVVCDIRFIISYSCCLIRPAKGGLEVGFMQKFLESQMADQAL